MVRCLPHLSGWKPGWPHGNMLTAILRRFIFHRIHVDVAGAMRRQKRFANAKYLTSICVRSRSRTGEDNADAHLKRQLMGREVVVAVTEGRLEFGPWEQIF